ncbi:MAG TPA: hypothetical protein VIS06_18395 [Mycobacteriales bacterium]
MNRTAEGPAPGRTGPNEIATAGQLLGAEGNPGHGQVPLFRSPEWYALDNTDPRKSLAVFRAAEAWHRYWTPGNVARRLAEELARVDAEVRRRVRESSWDVNAAADWQALAQQPTYAALAELRAEVPNQPCGSPTCRGCATCVRAEWVARHGGDYVPGQRVTEWGNVA